MHQNAVADLFGEPQHHTAVQFPIFGVISAVAVGLQLSLFSQMLCFRCGSLLRAWHTGAEPQMAPQVVAHAKLLLSLAQPFRRVEGAAEAAFDVGSVLRGILLQGDVGPAFVHRQSAAHSIHGA